MGDRHDVDVEPHNGDVDRGFTLIEILIVLSIMGVIAGALAMTVSIVLRTAPSSEVRVDDARTIQGLVTWLPQDVDAAPPGSFNTDPAAPWPCNGTTPSNSFNVLTMHWTERADSTTNFVASYRYEFNGSTWHILRYTCDDTSSSMSFGQSLNMTDGLPPWNNLAPPARVTMCDTAVDNAGDCPVGHEITTNTPPHVESLKFSLTRLDGEQVVIDAAPKNPDQNLADDPNASSNAAPTVSQTNYTVDMFAGETVTVDLNTTHNPSDADGDALSVAIDSSEPAPPGITATTSDPLNVTLTADPSLSTGTIATRLVLVVSDPRAGWVDPTLTINIVPQSNTAPTAVSLTHSLQLAPGQTAIVPLDVAHGIVDPDGDPLTASVIFPSSARIQPPTFDDPTRPLDLTVKAKGAAPLGAEVAPIEVTVDDGRGGFVLVQIFVEVINGVPNTPPTLTSPNVDIDMFAGDTITLSLDTTHGASDADGDPLAALIDTSAPQPSGITTTLSGLEVEITTDQSLVVGPLSSPLALNIRDGHGGTVDVTITITIIPTPPPPSDCVLGTLTATPSSVNRQGNGSSPKHLKQDVTVSLTYSGSCDGLVLKYDTGDTSGLGIGSGRVFPVGSPSTIVIVGKPNGGTEKWLSGTVTLTASTTSAVTPTSVTTTLVVN